MRLLPIFLFLPWALGATSDPEPAMMIFEIRKDLAYAEASIEAENVGKYLKIYRTGIPLPSTKAKEKRATNLLLGTVSIVAIEKDYVVVKIPDELIPDVRKGDILRFDASPHTNTVSASVDQQQESKVTEEEKPVAPNYIYFAGQLAHSLNANHALGIGDLAYQRSVVGLPLFSGIKPDYVIAGLRPVVARSGSTERPAMTGFFQFTFMTQRWVFVNTGLQLGLKQTGTVGGGLLGIGFKLPGILKAETNIEWLYEIYTDAHAKLTYLVTHEWFFTMQTGLLAINGTATRTDYYPNGNPLTHTYDQFTNFAYLTLGIGITNTRGVRVATRAGLMGDKLDSLGVIGRLEIGIGF